jgi:uncharacterized protein YukE
MEVKKTESFWVGDAADLQRAAYNEQLPEIERMIELLNNQATTLRQIAENYAAAKGYSVSLVETLPDNIVS